MWPFGTFRLCGIIMNLFIQYMQRSSCMHCIYDIGPTTDERINSSCRMEDSTWLLYASKLFMSKKKVSWVYAMCTIHTHCRHTMEEHCVYHSNDNLMVVFILDLIAPAKRRRTLLCPYGMVSLVAIGDDSGRWSLRSHPLTIFYAWRCNVYWSVRMVGLDAVMQSIPYNVFNGKIVDVRMLVVPIATQHLIRTRTHTHTPRYSQKTQTTGLYFIVAIAVQVARGYFTSSNRNVLPIRPMFPIHFDRLTCLNHHVLQCGCPYTLIYCLEAICVNMVYCSTRRTVKARMSTQKKI